MLLVESWQEGQRQRYQALSVIAWETAVLTARCLAGETVEPVYQCFPFWEQAERDELRLAGYRAMMERLAGGERRNTHA